MNIKRGDLFKGNKNNRVIMILSADEINISYKDMKYGTIFTTGRKCFERCDLSHIKKED